MQAFAPELARFSRDALTYLVTWAHAGGDYRFPTFSIFLGNE